MSVPQGYVKIEPNTLYENIEYYIDTSVSAENSNYNNYVNESYLWKSNIATTPYISEVLVDGMGYLRLYHADGYVDLACTSNVSDPITSTGWYTSNITNGIVTGYPTLNINLTISPNWLYVKTPATQPATHEMTITLGEGVESLEMNFTEPDLSKVTLRVYTFGDVSESDFVITVSENDNVIFEESGTLDAIDTTLEVTQNSTITVEATGSPWEFTIYKDGSSVTSSGMDGQTYSFTITDNTTISVYCNYD